MTTEAKSKIVDEVKRFAADLNLSESQKSQLQAAYEMKIVVLRAAWVTVAFLALSTSSWASGFINGEACLSNFPGSPNTSNATLGQFLSDCGSNPTVTFTTNFIDFSDPGVPPGPLGTETFGSFLGNDLPASVAGAVYSNPGVLSSATSDNGSIWAFAGTGYFGPGFSVTHDDGFSLYLDGGIGSRTAVAGSGPGPTNATTTLLPTVTPGVHDFVLVFAESNGAPAVLNANIQPVPEPRQIGLVLFGLLGIAVLVRRKFAPSR
jgi:hypothetical protein